MKKYCLFLFCVLLGVQSHAQKNTLDTLVSKFNKYRISHAQEKIYAHVSQEALLTGETIWFQLYTVDGAFHMPTDISKVAYVEILDQQNRSLLNAKVQLKDGSGHGSIFIPATIPSGVYVFRAYTNWMKNWSADFFFQQKISIINPFVRTDPPATVSSPSGVLQVFPEGGSLVNNMKSKIAFHLTDGNGKGIEGRGAVVNASRDTLTTFQTSSFGMGYFFITPEAGKKYDVVVRTVSGKVVHQELPEVRKKGYVMTVVDSLADALVINVRENFDDDEPRFVYLLTHARQVIVQAEFKFMSRGKAQFILPVKNLPEGINHLTLFDNHLRPVAERLYFKRPSSPLNFLISTDRREYAPRRKVSVVMEANVSGKPVAAHTSVAVYKLDSINREPTGNIFYHLWLTSDLHGFIESPGYYFTEQDEQKRKAATDLLMLTHGWRKFRWKSVLEGGDSIQHLPEYHGMLVQGAVTGVDGKPAPGIFTYLAMPGRIVRLHGARSNEQGEIQFELKDIFGSKKLIVQTNTKIDSTYKIIIKDPFSTENSTLPKEFLWINSSLEKPLTERSIAMQVQDIYSGLPAATLHTVDSSAFFGIPDETYYLDDYTRFPVMEEVMREYVPGVLVRKRKDGFHFIVLDDVHHSVFNSDPLVLLDGVPVFDVDQIMKYDPLKVKKLEVVRRKYYQGPLTLSGIVSYSTYQGDLAGFSLDPRAMSINFEGLQLERQFASPVYENENQRNSRLPDQRNLLYWSPEVKSKSVEFYTADQTGEYIVVAEGLTDKGEAGYSVQKFSVRRFDN